MDYIVKNDISKILERLILKSINLSRSFEKQGSTETGL